MLALCVHAGFLALVTLRKVADPPPEDQVIHVVLVPRTSAHDRSAQPRPTSPFAHPGAGNGRAALAGDARAGSDLRADGPAPEWRVRPGETPEAELGRKALRKGVGCRSAEILALTEAERQACNEALAAGSQTAPEYAVISPKLKKQFDGVFECPKDDVWCEYRIGKAPYPGLFAPRKKRERWD